MKVTYNWLKDFVEIKILPQALANKLTMAGLEVTSLEAQDRDCIFEIEITSNRPDLLSVIGIAREVAAITNKKLKLPQVKTKAFQVKPHGAQPISIKIEDKKDCPLYTAKIIQGVKVGPSPDWLRRRLELVGCRSINNIVDITNYVLLEWGEPLHAFDQDKLVSSLGVIVRRAKKGEEIVTIDGVKRTLDENILIIASEISKHTDRPTDRQTNRPVALAGIMGGRDTEVTEDTTNVLLEAAIFDPIVIRRGRQKLGTQTDSSYRFERGIDAQSVGLASWRAAQLIQEIAGGSCVLTRSAGRLQLTKRSVDLSVAYLARVLGADIEKTKISKILGALNFKVQVKSKDKFKVDIPSFRQDVKAEVDLAEEIARIFGYEHIAATMPKILPQNQTPTSRDLISCVKNTLTGLGLNEVISYSLMNKELLQLFQAEEDKLVSIANPLSEEQEILRTTLLPSLARCVAYNFNQKQEYINIFEIAKTYSLDQRRPREQITLAIALCGTHHLWSGHGRIKDRMGFLHLKGISEILLARLGIKGCSFRMSADDFQIEVYVKEERIGQMLRLKPDILDKLDIKNKEAFLAELNLEKLLSYANIKKQFRPLPVYPGISRDISLVLKDDIPVAEVMKAINQLKESLLEKVTITDYYQGRQIPANCKGLTISCFYISDTRTLTEAEINPIHKQVLDLVTQRFKAQIR